MNLCVHLLSYSLDADFYFLPQYKPGTEIAFVLSDTTIKGVSDYDTKVCHVVL